MSFHRDAKAKRTRMGTYNDTVVIIATKARLCMRAGLFGVAAAVVAVRLRV